MMPAGLAEEAYPFPAGTCAHCGRVCGVGTPGGLGSVNGKPVCHPGTSGRPDCYRLVTVYHQFLGALMFHHEPPVERPEDKVGPEGAGAVTYRIEVQDAEGWHTGWPCGTDLEYARTCRATFAKDGRGEEYRIVKITKEVVT